MSYPPPYNSRMKLKICANTPLVWSQSCPFRRRDRHASGHANLLEPQRHATLATLKSRGGRLVRMP